MLAPRHIEVQVFGDTKGNVVHLGERDCSVQRRHQKVVEEAPSPVVTPQMRAELGAAAVALTKAAGYVGAGTVEFLWEDGAFWFLEMNARLQVEHPVTEAVTGLDLVEWQIRIARGEPLPLAQDQITLTGHAIEVRLYAEDPTQGFLPQTGSVLRWRPAPGLRVDHALAEGQDISGSYDPMLAKLIAHGPDRDTARRKLIAGLSQTRFQGLRNNKAFLINVLRHPGFADGLADTGFLGGEFKDDRSRTTTPPDAAMLALAVLINAKATGHRFGFSTAPALALTRRFEVGDQSHAVTLTLGPGATAQVRDGPTVVLEALATGVARAVIDGVAVSMPVSQQAEMLYLDDLILRDVTLAPSTAAATGSDGQVRAPMAGGVVDVLVTEGDTVAAGQVLAVLEAMKMEHPVRSPIAGRVIDVAVTAKSQVRARQRLFQINSEVT
ncbi:biotin/lipoyl-containing protein [Pararhodobacter sp.]|uniref:ATP-binding protein n=1 Tax=Pararhodobacter sp. TaxID=2127056 RepID=UPI002AFFF3DD|nr:biotin/lipoyl-containing protein [Pararhodobacter sp.]